MLQSTTGDFVPETLESVWDRMRQEMRLPGIHLDHAGVSPWPDRTRRSIVDWAEKAAVDPIQASMAGYARADEVRAEIGDWLGVSGQEICYTRNTTEGLTLVAEGFPWQPGESVVVPADEYPTNLHPWRHLRSRGVEVREVVSVDHRLPVELIEKAVDSTTRMISISYVQYGTGFRADLASLGKLCERRGLFFTVDAIQGLGVLPMQPKDWGIHALACGGSKWLLGPQGVGFLYLDAAWRDRVRPTSVGWHSVEEPFRFRHEFPPLVASSKRYEGGTINPGLVSALGHSIAFLRQPDTSQWLKRIRLLTDRMVEGLESMGVRVVSPREEGAWSGIVAARVSGMRDLEYGAMLKKLRDQSITANYRMGNLRFSPHGYNSLEDVDRMLEVMRGLTS
jgi:selenocysteine lyase/cysteine desulfurase